MTIFVLSWCFFFLFIQLWLVNVHFTQCAFNRSFYFNNNAMSSELNSADANKWTYGLAIYREKYCTLRKNTHEDQTRPNQTTTHEYHISFLIALNQLRTANNTDRNEFRIVSWLLSTKRWSKHECTMLRIVCHSPVNHSRSDLFQSKFS